MKVAVLTSHIVRLPLRWRIRHASAERAVSRSVVIRCELSDGTVGWGEGVPREYVTGETPEGAIDQLAHTPVSDQLAAECHSWADVIALCDRFRPAELDPDPRGCRGNALRCAVELSILDAFGRRLEEPLSAITAQVDEARALAVAPATVRYSMTIAGGRRWKSRLLAASTRLYGFRHCKVKLGIDGEDDVRKVRMIRRWLGTGIDLRLDVNGAWSADDVVHRTEPLLGSRISCLEQPVPHAEVGALSDIRHRLPVPIMLDESLTSFTDAATAIRERTCDLFNIRLSKCGGFLNSLRLAALARGAGLGYQLGCHPGESGILSAAGRQWASSVADVRFLEGSFDRYLLRRRLTHEDVSFGRGGLAQPIRRPGLGVVVDPIALDVLALTKGIHRVT